MTTTLSGERSAGVASGLLGLASAYLLGHTLASFSLDPVRSYSLALFGVLLFRVVLDRTEDLWWLRVRSRHRYQWGQELDSFIATGGSGDIVSLEGAVEHLVNGVGLEAARVAAGVSFLSLGVLCFNGGWLTLLVFLGVMGCSVPFYIRAGRRSERASADFDERHRVLGQQQLDILRATPDLRASGGLDFAVTTIVAVSESEHRLVRQTLRETIGSSLTTEFLGGVGVGLAAMVVGFGVLDRSRSLSDALVTLFVTVEIVARLRRYATDFHRRSDAARATALLAVLDLAPANAADTITGAFRVRDLLTQGMVTPLSFDLARGQSLSVYGASGSGKSSLVDVLLGLRAPLSGSVSRAHLTTGLIRPTASFFRASVRENLGLGTASDVDILATLEALGLGRSRYAELDVVLSDDGSQMSSGERVRLALARALLAGVEVLVFDDVAMLLDDESRHLVAESVTNRDLTLIEVTQGARIVVTPDFLVPLGEI